MAAEDYPPGRLTPTDRSTMPIGRILFIAFLLVPLAEIYLLVRVGNVIGALPTVVLVVLTALLGAALIRVQGLATLARIRGALDRGEVPAVELLEGACLLVAGALLMTPGFVTDSVGFLLLVPGLRRHAILALVARGVVATQHPAGRGSTAPGGGRIIEGEFRREDPE